MRNLFDYSKIRIEEENIYRMQYSGYNKRFRYEIIHAFEEVMKKDESGKQQLYHSKSWKRKERRELKEDRRKVWHKRGGYKSVIFVSCTKESNY